VVGQIEPGVGHFAPVYEELRRIARAYLRGESHTLQPTALVHEAYLKLRHIDPELWASQEHFTNAAARAMRQILVDHARYKLAQKRQNESPFPEEGPDMEVRLTRLLHLEDGLRQLEELDPQMVRIVELRFFVGCTEQETGQFLGLDRRAVRRHWGMAKAFLADWLEA
jgi:RNA polymerase sigma factor (TIGR02999 family)